MSLTTNLSIPNIDTRLNIVSLHRRGLAIPSDSFFILPASLSTSHPRKFLRPFDTSHVIDWPRSGFYTLMVQAEHNLSCFYASLQKMERVSGNLDGTYTNWILPDRKHGPTQGLYMYLFLVFRECLFQVKHEMSVSFWTVRVHFLVLLTKRHESALSFSEFGWHGRIAEGKICLTLEHVCKCFKVVSLHRTEDAVQGKRERSL